MGPFLAFHLGGGSGGMRQLLEHLGPSLKDPTTRIDAPELTPELIGTVVAGCERQVRGKTPSNRARRRGAFLSDLQNLLSKYQI